MKFNSFFSNYAGKNLGKYVKNCHSCVYEIDSFFVTGLSSEYMDVDPASITQSQIGQEEKKEAVVGCCKIDAALS